MQRRLSKNDAPITLVTLPGVQSLSALTRFIDGGRERFVEIVQLAMLNNDPVATEWWKVYAELPPYPRSIVSFDDVCAASGVRPKDLCLVIVSTAIDFGQDAGNFVAAMTHPKIVGAMARSAERIDGEFAEIGIRDRHAFLQGQRFLPIPKSATINVNASASAQAAAAAQEPSVPGFASDISQARQVGGGSTVRGALSAPDAALDPFTQVLEGAVVPAAPLAVPISVPTVDRDLDGR